MPFEKFDRSKLDILPLNERIHDVDLAKVYKDPATHTPDFTHPALPELAKAVHDARRKYDATVLMMYGAHVIRTGNAGYMIELMKKGIVTHFATNGAGSIHDFEFAMIGHTCESVAKYISEGQFGLWQETGVINDIIVEGARDGLGWGEALGRYIWENNFPNREKSVLAMGYDLLKELKKIGADTRYMIVTDEITTATYLKTMRLGKNGEYREGVRYDFRNRSITSAALLDRLFENFKAAIPEVDGVIVSDQYFERNSGVVGDYLREKLNEYAKSFDIPFLVDFRTFASEFCNMYVKCNNFELMKYCGAKGDPESREDVVAGGNEMKKRSGRPVFITRNKDGILIFDDELSAVPAYPVAGEIDVTGAGDASNAGIIIGLTLGLSPAESAMIACATSSITIQQLGTTGTATVEDVIERLAAIADMME